MYSVDCCPKGLVVGKQGENEAEKVVIDFSSWASEFGAGVISARLRRPKDSAAYPVTLTTEGTTATWTVSATDTQYAGAGSLQLVYIVGEVVAKSVIWPVRVLPSLEAGEAPDPYESWLDTLEGVAAEAQSAQRGAEAARDAAEDYSIVSGNKANEAAASAQAAADSAASITGLTAVAQTLPEGSEASASFDASTDTLTLGIPKGDTGATGPAGPVGPKGDTGAAGADGFSPSVTVTEITGGHQVSVTDAEGTQTFDVMDGVSPVLDDEVTEDSANGVKSSGIYDAIVNLLPVDTASGAIASFPDGADDVPMLSLKAQIEPVQDLHGYDSPWPAGGGENKANLAGASRYGTTYGLTTTIDEESETITISGTFTGMNTYAQYRFATFPNTEHGLNLKAFNLTSGAYVDALSWDGSVQHLMTIIIRGLTEGASVNLRFRMVAYSGSTAPTSWTPYSNICPISGHTEVDTHRTGKNLADNSQFSIEQPSWYTGQYWLGLTNNGDGTYTETRPIGWGGYGFVYVGTFKSGTYFVSAELKDLANVACAMNYIFKRKGTWDTVESYTNSSISSLGRYGASKTINEECDLWLVCAPYTSNGANVKFGNIQVEAGSTATAYEPFEGETITQEFVDEQGNQLTVYGGESEIVGGKLTSKMAMVDLGTLNWGVVNSNFFYAGAAGMKANANTEKCSAYATVNAYNDYNFADKSVSISQFMGRIAVHDSAYTDATAFKTAMNGVQLCYELAEPIEYTLTAQEVRTFLGQNNIWADTGNTEVTYRADIAKYIEKKVNA